MYVALIVVHVLVCFAIIGIVLLPAGQGPPLRSPPPGFPPRPRGGPRGGPGAPGAAPGRPPGAAPGCPRHTCAAPLTCA